MTFGECGFLFVFLQNLDEPQSRDQKRQGREDGLGREACSRNRGQGASLWHKRGSGAGDRSGQVHWDPWWRTVCISNKVHSLVLRETGDCWLCDSVTLCICVCLSPVWLFATPWTAAHQAPLSMGFFRQEYWSGVPFPPPGIEPGSPVSPAELYNCWASVCR